MLKKNLVFVLGAGASKPYGFPTGEQLRHEIVAETLKPGDPRHKVLVECEFSYATIEECRVALARSWASSIDMFLATRPELAEVGKAAIALTIARYEIDDKLFFAQPQIDWFRCLWRLMHTQDRQRFRDQHVKFVTFNYDRTLEHALANGLEHAYNVTGPALVELMPPVIHVYGSLGPYPIQGFGARADARPFAAPSTVESTLASAMQINVMSEKEADSPYPKLAQEALKDASMVVMLSFGYDVDNLALLRLSQSDSCLPRECPIRGTRYGLEDQEANHIVSMVSNGGNGNTLICGDRDDDCHLYLRKISTDIRVG